MQASSDRPGKGSVIGDQNSGFIWSEFVLGLTVLGGAVVLGALALQFFLM